MANIHPDFKKKMARAVGIVNLELSDPSEVLLQDVVKVLVDRTTGVVMQKAFRILASPLPVDYMDKPIARLFPNPDDYFASIGLDSTIGSPFTIPWSESSLNDDVPYIIHARYHRLAGHLVLLASLPTDGVENASRAAQFKNHVLEELCHLAIKSSTNHVDSLFLPHPIYVWVVREIEELHAKKQAAFGGGGSHQEKRIKFQIQHLEGLLTNGNLKYGWKLFCCKQVMSKSLEGLEEVVEKLEQQDENLKEVYRILAHELPAEFMSQPIGDLLPHTILLGLPLDMDKPFFKKMDSDVNKYNLAKNDERELFELLATYHQIARLIILHASLARSEDNTKIAATLKERGIYPLLQECALMYSFKAGACMGIPEPIVKWVENDVEQLKKNLSKMDASGDQLKQRQCVIEERENIIYRTIDYFDSSL